MNIIYIHTHDTGVYTSVHGYKTPTPNLLDFAKDATVYRNAYCVSPTCSPSRAALLTGQYPHNNGLIGLAHRGFKLNNPKQHLANFLKSHGYHTVLSGVQHENGFWTKDLAAKELGYETVLTQAVQEKEGEGYSLWDQENCKKLCDWIDNYDKDQPLFISYGLFATHRPYPKTTISKDYIQVPEGLQDNDENRKDTAELHQSLSNFDKQFSNLINTLKNNGLYEQSLILVTTDHGLANPLAKCTLNKKGTHTLLMIRYPKDNEQGRVVDDLVSQLDIFPTLCDVIGIKKPEYLQGKSLRSEKNSEIFQEINVHTSYEPARAIRTSRFLYIQYLDESWMKYNLSNCDQSAAKKQWIDEGWQHKTKEKQQLYDLLFDPQEKQNVANNPEYKNQLMYFKERMNQWRKETEDKLIDYNELISNHKVNKKQSISPTIQCKDDQDFPVY